MRAAAALIDHMSVILPKSHFEKYAEHIYKRVKMLLAEPKLRPHHREYLAKSMVISTGPLQSMLLPLARRALGLPDVAKGVPAAGELESSAAAAAKVVVRDPVDPIREDTAFVLPLEQLAGRAGLLDKATLVISQKPPKAVLALRKLQADLRGCVENTASEYEIKTSIYQLQAQMTRNDAIHAGMEHRSAVDCVAMLMHLARATRARCSGQAEARTVPSAVSLEQYKEIGFTVPVEEAAPMRFDSSHMSLDGVPDAAQLRTLAAVALLGVPTQLDRRRLVRDLAMFVSKEPLDWKQAKLARIEAVKGVGLEQPGKVASKAQRNERVYRWSLPLFGIESSKANENRMQALGPAASLEGQQAAHLDEFERVILSHAQLNPVAAAMVALATGDQKLLRLGTIEHMQVSSRKASIRRGRHPSKEGQPALGFEAASNVAGRDPAARLPVVDADTSGSDTEHASDAEGEDSSHRAPTLDMGFYHPSAPGELVQQQPYSSGQDAEQPAVYLPNLKRMHKSTDRMAGMPAPPYWLRWIGLVQADGSLGDAGHSSAYSPASAESTSVETSKGGTVEDRDLPPLFGRVRIRSSMVRSIDSAIKTVQLDSLASSNRTLGFLGVRLRPSAVMVALQAAIDKAQGEVSVDEAVATEQARTDRREARKKREAARTYLVETKLRAKRLSAIGMLRGALRPFGQAAVRAALDEVVAAHANPAMSAGDVTQAENRCLLQMKPHLGPAFRPMYPMLRSIFRDLTPEDLDRLYSDSHVFMRSDAARRLMQAESQSNGAGGSSAPANHDGTASASAGWQDARLPASGALDTEWSRTLRAAAAENHQGDEAVGGQGTDPSLVYGGEAEDYSRAGGEELEELTGEAENMLEQLMLEVELELDVVFGAQGVDSSSQFEGDDASNAPVASPMEQASPEQADLCKKLVLLLAPRDLLDMTKQLRQAKRSSWNEDATSRVRDWVRQRLGINAIAVETSLAAGLRMLQPETLEAFALEYYGRQTLVSDMYAAVETDYENRQLVSEAMSRWDYPTGSARIDDESRPSGTHSVVADPRSYRESSSANASSWIEDSDDEEDAINGMTNEALQAWREAWKEQHGGRYGAVADKPLAYAVGEEEGSVTEDGVGAAGTSSGASRLSYAPQPTQLARSLGESLFESGFSQDPMQLLDVELSRRAERGDDLVPKDAGGGIDEEEETISQPYDVAGLQPQRIIDAGMVGPAAYMHSPVSTASSLDSGGSALAPSPFVAQKRRPPSLSSPEVMGVVRAPLRFEARIDRSKVLKKLGEDQEASPLSSLHWGDRFDDGSLGSASDGSQQYVPAPCHDGSWSQDVEMRTVLVEGVPPGTTPQQLKDSLRGLGEVQSVRFVGARTQGLLRAVRDKILRRSLAELKKAGKMAENSAAGAAAGGASSRSEQAEAIEAGLEGDDDDDGGVDIDERSSATFRTSHAMQQRNDGREALVSRVAWGQSRASSRSGRAGSKAQRRSLLNQVPPLLLAFDTAIEARYGPVQRVLGERNLPLTVYNEPAPSIPTPSDSALPAVQPQTHRQGLGKLLRHEITQIERIVRMAPSHAFVTFADPAGAAAAADPEVRIFGVVVGQTACRIRPAEGNHVLHVSNVPQGVTPLALYLQLNSVLREAGASVGLKRARKLPEHVVSADNAMLKTHSLWDALVLEKLLSQELLRPEKPLYISYCSEQDWIQAGKRLHAARV